MTSPTWADWLTESTADGRGTAARLLALRPGRRTAWLVAAIYAGCLAAFIADVTSINLLAFGVFYTPLVGTAIFHVNPRAVWWLAAGACVMVVIGALFPAIDRHVGMLIGNCALSICAILATAVFVRHARRIQDALAAQTERAEAAERIKSEVLDNLTQEIRAPLYSMIGVLELVSADSRPDQKAALGMVRGAGRRLVATLDNLVDLTQSGHTPLRAEPVDLGMLLRQVAEAGRSDATARQLSLTIEISPDTSALVHANPWAARRVLENLIADAIAYTAPGGEIAVRTLTEAGHVVAEVRDTGTRPPGTSRFATDPDIARLMPSAMGLALGQRLARAMGARLTFSSEPGVGTTARLVLPVEGRINPGRY